MRQRERASLRERLREHHQFFKIESNERGRERAHFKESIFERERAFQAFCKNIIERERDRQAY